MAVTTQSQQILMHFEKNIVMIKILPSFDRAMFPPLSAHMRSLIAAAGSLNSIKPEGLLLFCFLAAALPCFLQPQDQQWKLEVGLGELSTLRARARAI
jgi:hypothetical protein